MNRPTSSAEAFRQLHRSGLLIIANVWDAGSARLVESLGARAVATTSAGVAWCHGYPDGDVLPPDLLLATIRSIVRVVSLPLSIDLEGGYSHDAEEVADLVARAADAGAVGINLEDGSESPELLCAKIEAIRTRGATHGFDVFVNARTDVFLRGLAKPETRVTETLARARLYAAAGADGLFVPGLVGADEMKAVAAGTGLPLNVMARPGLASAGSLQALGVRRLSAGSGLFEAAFGRVAALAAGFLDDGDSAPLLETAMPYPRINALMSGG
ncbi:MAG: isocitrate lyase/phosphoenolpyruvate mutase family protein [Microvirga sp.]